MNYPTTAKLMVMISETSFMVFDSVDWEVFSGCQTDDPRIGFKDEYTIVIDGSNINVVHRDDEFGGRLYSLEAIQ